MNWLDKLEKKYPRFAIPNVTLVLVIGNIIGYFIYYTAPQMLSFLSFNAYYILHGQIWRLVTWIVYPSTSVGNTTSFILTAVFLLCAASWGRSLERMLGNFRMSVFVVGGIIISDIGGFLFYAITYFLPTVLRGVGVSPSLTTYYIILSILMEIAVLFPEGQVRLWFILPIKMKWMIYITLAEFAYEIFDRFTSYLDPSVQSVFRASFGITSAQAKQLGIIYASEYAVTILLAMANLAIFYFANKNRVSRAHKKRQQQFRQEFRQAEPRPGSGITKHKCAICGRTEVTNPELTFRYCSKCPSGLEYCNDHLFTHVHK